MPPQRSSRHLLTTALTDNSERVFLSERVPFRFIELPDNRKHTVKEGDDLFNIAGRYFAPLNRPAGFFWAVADFQPDPIIDPTLKITFGRILFVPSIRTLVESILSEDRREDFSPNG